MMNTLPFSDIRQMNLAPPVAIDDNSLVPDGTSVYLRLLNKAPLNALQLAIVRLLESLLQHARPLRRLHVECHMRQFHQPNPLVFLEQELDSLKGKHVGLANPS